MATTDITQCKLKRLNVETTEWIPSNLAVKDSVLKDGWIVAEVYERVTADESRTFVKFGHRGLKPKSA